MSRQPNCKCAEYGDICPSCETDAERRKEDREMGYAYTDRELDAYAEGAARDMIFGREW